MTRLSHGQPRRGAVSIRIPLPPPTRQARGTAVFPLSVRRSDRKPERKKGTAVTATYSNLPNKLVSAANGIDYAYRDAGDGAVPLVLLQHFRGNLDSWDPALIDALAATRRVLTFDNTGVGGSSGTTPNLIQQMAPLIDPAYLTDPATSRG